MERHQAGQEETLMEVKVDMDSVEVVHQPRGSPADRRGCPNCVVALVTVMGLVIVALVAGFILHYFMFTPSCNQDAPPLNDSAKIIKLSSLKESEDQGRYDIFTVDSGGTYIIYVFVKFSDVISKEVELLTTVDGHDNTLSTKKVNQAEVVFLEKAILVNGSRISIYFKSAYKETSVLVCKL